MDVSNIFKYINANIKSQDTLLFITEYDFFLNIISINIENYKINLYSDEFLYLINYNYPCQYYNYYVNNYHLICNNMSEVHMYDVNAIQFVTTFSRGSVHGFSGFYHKLIEYLNNYDTYKDLYLIVYMKSEKGILDIINYLCINCIIDKSKIIYIDKNKLYKFKSIQYIPNDYHVFQGNLLNKIDIFINKYISRTIFSNNIENSNRIALIKNNITPNVTSNGCFDSIEVLNFCKKNNFKNIGSLNEIELITQINNCQLLIVSYGSAFFKNIVYISEKCEKIIVLINGDTYTNDYLHLSSVIPTKYQGIIFNKYKNADVKYIITNNLDFLPL